MIRNRIEGLYHIQAAALMLAQSFGFWFLVASLQLLPFFDISDLSRYAVYNLAGILGFVIYLFQSDSSRLNLLAMDPLDNVRISSRQTLFIAIAIIFLMVATKDRTLSRMFLFTYIPVCFGINFVTNQFIPRYLSKLVFSTRHQNRTLLVGSGARVKRLNRWLHYTIPYGVNIEGIVSSGTTARRTCGFPVLGGLQDLDRILQEYAIEQVIMLETPKNAEAMSSIIESTDRRGTRLLICDDTAEKFRHPIGHFHHLGVDFITLREEPLQDPVNRILKRFLDICISLPVVLILLPLLSVIVWIFQRMESPGPLYYQQLRNGTKRSPFEILKFRTMDAENEAAAQQATVNDARVYPFGRFLRKTSLDEFPQFLNVLRGEMSVVGPRPHMLEHDAEFSKVMTDYHVRSYVKPGITGLAQVRGYRGEARSAEDIRSRALCDIEYIERWSPTLDLLIIVRTAMQVIRPLKTAY